MFDRLFDFSGLAPHGMCLLWRSDLFWALGGADAIISASYYSIAASIAIFIALRQDMYLRWVAVLFAGFILLCATSHATDVWTLWYPDYGPQVVVKMLTAVASLVTAAALWPLMPRALTLPSSAQLAAANAALTREIAERRQVEESLRETEDSLRKAGHSLQRKLDELKAANRELDSFAYAVSHDLRAPLRAMNGFSVALQEDYGDRLDGEAKEYLMEIAGASRHMGELIDGLLLLSRSTRGTLRHDPIDLSALAEGICSELAAAEPNRHVNWEIEPGLQARGDRRMIEAAMHNLLANAWKYTASVADAVIRVYAEYRDGVPLYFCVSDNGAGFDMAHAGKLFLPFQRLHRQDEFPGIGIGLATVERIIHRHGGFIAADAAVGRGATFRFTLPRLDEWDGQQEE